MAISFGSNSCQFIGFDLNLSQQRTNSPIAYTDINSEDCLVQATFAELQEKTLGWDSAYANDLMAFRYCLQVF
nr:hypothetical protein [uncultured Rhodoferax sp.]